MSDFFTTLYDVPIKLITSVLLHQNLITPQFGESMLVEVNFAFILHYLHLACYPGASMQSLNIVEKSCFGFFLENKYRTTVLLLTMISVTSESSSTLVSLLNNLNSTLLHSIIVLWSYFVHFLFFKCNSNERNGSKMARISEKRILLARIMLLQIYQTSCKSTTDKINQTGTWCKGKWVQ